MSNNARKEELQKFSLIIEKIAKEKKLSYIDALVWHCEKTGLEIEIAAKSITTNLKSKIKMEAEDLNILKRSNKRLPI